MTFIILLFILFVIGAIGGLRMIAWFFMAALVAFAGWIYFSAQMFMYVVHH